MRAQVSDASKSIVGCTMLDSVLNFIRDSDLSTENVVIVFAAGAGVSFALVGSILTWKLLRKGIDRMHQAKIDKGAHSISTLRKTKMSPAAFSKSVTDHIQNLQENEEAPIDAATALYIMEHGNLFDPAVSEDGKVVLKKAKEVSRVLSGQHTGLPDTVTEGQDKPSLVNPENVNAVSPDVIPLQSGVARTVSANEVRWENEKGYVLFRDGVQVETVLYEDEEKAKSTPTSAKAGKQNAKIEKRLKEAKEVIEHAYRLEADSFKTAERKKHQKELTDAPDDQLVAPPSRNKQKRDPIKRTEQEADRLVPEIELPDIETPDFDAEAIELMNRRDDKSTSAVTDVTAAVDDALGESDTDEPVSQHDVIQKAELDDEEPAQINEPIASEEDVDVAVVNEIEMDDEFEEPDEPAAPLKGFRYVSLNKLLDTEMFKPNPRHMTQMEALCRFFDAVLSWGSSVNGKQLVFFDKRRKRLHVGVEFFVRTVGTMIDPEHGRNKYLEAILSGPIFDINFIRKILDAVDSLSETASQKKVVYATGNDVSDATVMIFEMLFSNGTEFVHGPFISFMLRGDLLEYLKTREYYEDLAESAYEQVAFGKSKCRAAMRDEAFVENHKGSNQYLSGQELAERFDGVVYGE